MVILKKKKDAAGNGNVDVSILWALRILAGVLSGGGSMAWGVIGWPRHFSLTLHDQFMVSE
jgi:hypothetical protein